MRRPPRVVLDWVTRIYPRAWRERYGSEFEAMLEDLPEQGLHWKTVWDISKGAIAMRATQRPVKLMKMTAIFAMAGLIAGAGIAFAIPDSFLSVSLIGVDKSIDDQVLSGGIQRTMNDELMQSLVSKYGLYRGSTNAVDLLKKDFRVSAIKRRHSGNGFFYVGVHHANPETARRISLEVTEAIQKGHAGLSILDAPPRPHDPVFPNRRNIAIVGCTAGAVMGLILALWRKRYARPTSGTVSP
jgi:hypothetical protein